MLSLTAACAVSASDHIASTTMHSSVPLDGNLAQGILSSALKNTVQSVSPRKLQRPPKGSNASIASETLRS
eukprot:3878609-Amphidinium_carterae.1